jgi:hypothetical protein
MFTYTPIDKKDHDAILGVGFNTSFAAEMAEYYAPFVTRKRDIQVAKETWEYAVADSIPDATWV